MLSYLWWLALIASLEINVVTKLSELSKQGCSNCVPAFPRKTGCQKFEMNFCKLAAAIACQDFVPGLPDIVYICFCFQDSISWLGWGICWELSWGWRSGGGGLKMGGIKTLGCHSSTTKKCKLCKCNLTIHIIKPHTLMFLSNALKLLLNNYIFYNYWIVHNFLTKYS